MIGGMPSGRSGESFCRPAPADFDLKRWGLVMRIGAQDFSSEGGGTVQVRSAGASASGTSVAQWTNKGHWLEWEVDVPQEDDYFLVARYATPENARREVTLDGKPLMALQCATSGGFGSEAKGDWAFAVLAKDNAQPMPLRLSPGAHRLRLENQKRDKPEPGLPGVHREVGSRAGRKDIGRGRVFGAGAGGERATVRGQRARHGAPGAHEFGWRILLHRAAG